MELRLTSARVLAALLLLGVAQPSRAQVQSVPQQRCITSLEKAGAAVAAALSGDVAACVERAGLGNLPPGQSAQACLTADDRGKVARARTRTERAAAHCRSAPSFGSSSASAVSTAFAQPVAAAAIFGDDLDAAIISAANDPAGAACQAAVTRSLVAIVAARLKAFDRCSREGLKRASIRSRVDLEACSGVDTNGRVARAVSKARAIAAARCATTSVATAFPGQCAGATLDGLVDCLDRRIDCDVCRDINAADGLARGCHSFQDGVAVEYCGTRPTTTQSAARQWDEEILDAIRHDTPRPTVHARNLVHLSAAMWDAWRAYGGGGTAFVADEAHASSDPETDRGTAISFAAYRVLSHRYALSVSTVSTQFHLDVRMAALGFDKRFTDATGDAPASVGNRIGAAMIAHGASDGANEAGNYGDPTYTPVNDAMIVKLGGTVMNDPNAWQPLALDFMVTQNGIPIPNKIQSAIGMRWNNVTPFALTRANPSDVYIDPGPPPRLGTATDAEFKQAAVYMIERSSELTPDDGAMIDISPGAYGNNPLGTNDGTGHPVNPVTGQPYTPQVVKRGDFARVLAEFWADGPSSETPPGHWNVLANYVTDNTPAAEKRIAGTGAVLSPLEWDVKLYLALNGAVHDAAITAWGLKRKYDSVRPISMVRYLGEHGQSSDPDGPSYHPNGLPLVPGLIEVVTPESSAPGERHEALDRHLGEIAVLAWPGQPANPATTYSGVHWVRASDWLPYQKNTFVTPAFAGFTSGHSTFSRAAAEVLAAFTGSPYFPGGLGEFVAHTNHYLTFELGPTTDVHLQWATYYDAADQAGQSRIWGGIHITSDDFNGRITGSEIGTAAYEKALQYFDGTL